MTYPSSHNIQNYINKSTYHLVPVSEIVESDEVYNAIANICNEPVIYNFLFKNSLNGVRYSLENSKNFIGWAQSGWKEKSHFVFLLLSEIKEIVGSIDIKSNSTTNPEIGYWCSQSHSGLMTNTVLELAKLAVKNGILNFKALVTKNNIRSENVLIRSGFTKDVDESNKGSENNVYYKCLM